ncbi:MAG TPA: leucyl aminopeptidase [Burkholderiales bacterium]|nr:leucyl aminopeptidase [Burkholderiales bacterium]
MGNLIQFSIKSGAPERIRTACIVVGVFDSRKLSATGGALDRAARGYLSALLKRGDLDGKSGATLLLPRVPQLAAQRVLLVGLGREQDFGDRAFRDAVRSAVCALDHSGIPDAVLCLSAANRGRDIGWRVTQAVLVAADATYRFEQMKSKPEQRRGLREFSLLVERTEAARAAAALKRGVAVAHGVGLAKDLGNLPGNVCTPSYLAAQARALARSHRLKVQVLEKRDMQRLGMGALLSVARGSVEPPKLIVLQYQGAGRGRKPIVLVGKGVTFDSGGISIKPAADMDEMKFDMCGAASVLGTLRATAEMKLPLNIVGIVPATENMPSGSATKPGDVVKSLSGQTIEVLNTDAEGRLILCDALTYAERFEPQTVIDIATLTGACVIALGHVASGLFSADDALAGRLLAAGDASCDRAWRLPLWNDYQEQLRSNFADFANIGGRAAGSVTAACFLARFTGKFKWAHLDIAGTAWKSGKEKGATGRPVPLLAQFLLDCAANR